MGLDRIREQVKARIPDTDAHLKDSPLIDAALVRELARSGPDDGREERVVARLRALHQEWAVIPGASQISPADMLLGEALVRALRPKVEALRAAGFGSAAPPFSTLSEAVEWIEAQAAEARAEARTRGAERRRAVGEIERLAGENGLEVVFSPTRLPYQTPDSDHVKHAPTTPGTFPHRLTREVQLMAKYAGIPADALVTHVLVGPKPVRPRVRLTSTHNLYDLPDGTQIAADQTKVTFLTHDLKKKELRAIYEATRAPARKGTAGLDHKDVEIWALVQDLGGSPKQHGSKGAFWEEVLDTWNRRHPDERYTSANWAKKRYKIAAGVLTPF